MAGLPSFHDRIHHRRWRGRFSPTVPMDAPPEPSQRDFTRVGTAARRFWQVGHDMTMGLEPSIQRSVPRWCFWQTQYRAFAAAALQGLGQGVEDPEAQPQAALFPKPAEKVGVT